MKTLSCIRKHLQKVVCFILCIYSRAFNNNVISKTVNLIAVTTLTDARFTSLLAKNIEEEYKLFYAVRISISLASYFV